MMKPERVCEELTGVEYRKLYERNISMKQHVTLGVVCLARKTFDFNAAGELYKKIREDLGGLENVSLEMITDLVIEVEDAQKAARQLAAKNIDGLVCISGTFHLGHLVLEMERVLRKPILLWGLPELPYDGGKIRLNSVCGVNLNASNLYKSGVRNFHASVGGRIDEDWVDAVRVLAAFSTAHVGIAGFRAHGFFNLGVRDLNVYSNFGVLIDHYELHDVYEYPVQPADVTRRKDQLRSVYDVSGISGDQLDRVAMLSARMEKFLDDNRIYGTGPALLAGVRREFRRIALRRHVAPPVREQDPRLRGRRRGRPFHAGPPRRRGRDAVPVRLLAGELRGGLRPVLALRRGALQPLGRQLRALARHLLRRRQGRHRRLRAQGPAMSPSCASTPRATSTGCFCRKPMAFRWKRSFGAPT